MAFVPFISAGVPSKPTAGNHRWNARDLTNITQCLRICTSPRRFRLLNEKFLSMSGILVKLTRRAPALSRNVLPIASVAKEPAIFRPPREQASSAGMVPNGKSFPREEHRRSIFDKLQVATRGRNCGRRNYDGRQRCPHLCILDGSRIAAIDRRINRSTRRRHSRGYAYAMLRHRVPFS